MEVRSLHVHLRLVTFGLSAMDSWTEPGFLRMDGNVQPPGKSDHILKRQTRAPCHILSYRWKHSNWLLLDNFEGEPVSSSEWVQANGLGRRRWAVFLFQNYCTDFQQRHIFPSAEAYPSSVQMELPCMSSNTGLLWFVLQWRFSAWWNQLCKWSRGEDSHSCSSDFLSLCFSSSVFQSWRVACNKFPLQSLYVLVHSLPLLQLLLYILILIINL